MEEKLYRYTSPLYWAVQILFWTLKIIAFALGLAYRPIRNVFVHFYWVRRYSDEQCEKALKNLEKFYKGKKMRYDHKWTFDYCNKRLKDKKTPQQELAKMERVEKRRVIIAVVMFSAWLIAFTLLVIKIRTI